MSSKTGNSVDQRIAAVALALTPIFHPRTQRLELPEARAVLAAADAVDPLRQPGHKALIEGYVWTLQHPPECRADMLGCPLNKAMWKIDASSYADGIWKVELGKYGDPEFTFESAP